MITMAIDGIYHASLTQKQHGGTSIKYGKMELKTKNGKLSGSMFPLSFWLESPFRNGSVDGNQFCFTVHFASPCQQYEMSVTGTVEGDLVHGTAVTPLGEYELHGTRIG